MSDGFKLEGIFYTKKDGSIKGTALSFGKSWKITTSEGTQFNRQDIYLDRQRKVFAPKNECERDKSQSYVKEIIENYQKKLDSYEDNQNFKDVSPSYDMGHLLAKGYVMEYKQIFSRYFRSNAVKFIFDGWIDDGDE